MSKYYTGVGSRETPSLVLEAMTRIAESLQAAGYTLRSGGAGGADTAFEAGAGGDAEIYLPWEGFNGHTSPLFNVCEDAKAMAITVHKDGAALRLRKGVHLLHARNCYQVLGQRLDRPSDFTICWTRDAKAVGGTRTAIILSERNGLPVLNLGKSQTIEECMRAYERFMILVA